MARVEKARDVCYPRFAPRVQEDGAVPDEREVATHGRALLADAEGGAGDVARLGAEGARLRRGRESER